MQVNPGPQKTFSIDAKWNLWNPNLFKVFCLIASLDHVTDCYNSDYLCFLQNSRGTYYSLALFLPLLSASRTMTVLATNQFRWILNHYLIFCWLDERFCWTC